MKKSLREFWDTEKVCKNPHKGWYFHYYDQSLVRYNSRLADDDYLEDFPGLNHIYLRLAWSFLEPEEGEYNWRILDNVIEKWLARGYNAAFRVTCKETQWNQIFATPHWVKRAGARGGFYPCHYGDWETWEPDYSDPIFLEKLRNFHRAFAERYDGKSWVEYIDIGSYGDWGEGHTWFSSKKVWPFEVLKEHMDIHCACYKKTFLMANDDFIVDRRGDEPSKDMLLKYFMENGIGLRDDSPGITLPRIPHIFKDIWPVRPVDIECEHYSDIKERNAWNGGEVFVESVEMTHPTFIGFHGHPREWLSENGELAQRLANRVGYWYFIDTVEISSAQVQAGGKADIGIQWLNRGLAPAYYTYKLFIKMKNKDNGIDYTQVHEDSGNKSWMPDIQREETYCLDIPASFKAGSYDVGICLMEEREGCKRVIELGLCGSLKMGEGFVKIGEITVA